ncbi:MAG: DUF4919 domain-containing protein [bacterium]
MNGARRAPRHRRTRLTRCAGAAVVAALLVGCAAKTPPSGGSATKSSGAAPASADSVNFTQLRTQYGDRADFSAVCEKDRPLKQLIELTNAGRFDEVLAVSQPWLTHCPVDIDAQFVTGVALTELGRKPEGQQHLDWYKGLVSSVLDSGDGKTPSTAFTVISVEEEYAVLRALRLLPKSQAVFEGRINALTVTAPSGDITIFFNPAAHFRRLGAKAGAPQ